MKVSGIGATLRQPDLPKITPELADWLSQNYPEKLPDPEMPDRKIWIMVGERGLAARLLEIYRKQQEPST